MRKLLIALLFSTVMVSGSFPEVVQACPMCAEANETEDNRPKAYMYSILFMMAMPALIFTGFGIGFYRLRNKQMPLSEEDGTSASPESRF